MKTSSILSLFFGILLSASSWAGMQNIKCIWLQNPGSFSLIGDEVGFQIPHDNSSSSWVKAIDKATANKTKTMKNSIRFEANKVTYINQSGVKMEYIGDTEKNISHVKGAKEEVRTWKIPHPNASPKDENDFVATFQIFKKGIVLTFKDGSNPMVFTLKA